MAGFFSCLLLSALRLLYDPALNLLDLAPNLLSLARILAAVPPADVVLSLLFSWVLVSEAPGTPFLDISCHELGFHLVHALIGTFGNNMSR